MVYSRKKTKYTNKGKWWGNNRKNGRRAKRVV
jgi:hypothetical protein